MVNTGIDICCMLIPDATDTIGLLTVAAVSNFGSNLKKSTVNAQFYDKIANEAIYSNDADKSNILFFSPDLTKSDKVNDDLIASDLSDVKKSTFMYSMKNESSAFLRDSTSTVLAESMPEQFQDAWDNHFKRIFDIVSSSVTLLILAPLFLTVILLLKIFDPGPVFYSQRRIGKGGQTFPCYKFRTMTMNADKILESILANDPVARSEWDSIQKLTIDPRVTKLGNFLRVSSIDELPQLFNVLMGDMSFIGPRPIVDSESSRYGRYFNHYCVVKPGLTGLWQVSGRNLTTYRRRVALDTYYAKHVSLKLDMLIVLKTVPAVLFQRGVS